MINPNILFRVLWVMVTMNSFTIMGQNKGEQLLPKGIHSLTHYAEDSSLVKIIKVDNPRFKEAIQISSLSYKGNGDIILKAQVQDSITKGDILWLAFNARCLQSKRETGEAYIDVSLDRTVNGKYEWPPLISRGISFGKSWSATQIPLVASRSVKSGGLSFIIKCGTVPQKFELADLQLLNYGQSLKISDLPKSVVHYDGDRSDAPWRKEAAERIEKLRKGLLTISVINKNGKPVPNAQIRIRLKRLDFSWGTATNSKLLLDTVSPAAKTYRDTLLKYFNKVVFENEVKSKAWARFDHRQTLLAVEWLKSHEIPIRGHVMVWPSWQHSPQLTSLKGDTAGLRKAILSSIKNQADVLRGAFTEWDVLNEPYAHHDIIDLLGRHVMVDWFKEAAAAAPGVKLFLNDYTMFQGQGPNSPSNAFFDNIKYLKDNGAPINAIGEQGHVGGTPPGIPYILARLDRFATLGLPIQISEFDIMSDDDDFKMHYLKDFMTAIFSHPATIGLMQWGFWESDHWIPTAALWDKNWKIKPEGEVFASLVSHTWSTNIDGVTNAKGTFVCKGFNGKYEVTVVTKGKTVNRQLFLTREGKRIIFRLN